MHFHWYTFHRVLYNTKENNYGQSRKRKTLKIQKWTYILGRREYFFCSLYGSDICDKFNTLKKIFPLTIYLHF